MLKINMMLVFLLGVLQSGTSFAWRETGHWVVCEIGYRNLTPKTKRAVDQILGQKEYAPQCTWPDMVRKSAKWKITYDWHFINLENDQNYFEPANVGRNGDVQRAMIKASKVLSDPASSQAEKLIYLRFLGHFSGDSHQPLHVAKSSDLGGNKVFVNWLGAPTYTSVEILAIDPPNGVCNGPDMYVDAPTGECVKKTVTQEQTTLHKVWDLKMPQEYIKRANLKPLISQKDSVEYMHKAYAESILREVSTKFQKTEPYSVFYDWVKESRAYQKDAVYQTESGILVPGTTGILDEKYYFKHVGFMNQRLVQGGFRLATTLNRIFDPASVDPLSLKYWEFRSLELQSRIARLLKLANVPEL